MSLRRHSFSFEKKDSNNETNILLKKILGEIKELKEENRVIKKQLKDNFESTLDYKDIECIDYEDYYYNESFNKFGGSKCDNSLSNRVDLCLYKIRKLKKYLKKDLNLNEHFKSDYTLNEVEQCDEGINGDHITNRLDRCLNKIHDNNIDINKNKDNINDMKVDISNILESIKEIDDMIRYGPMSQIAVDCKANFESLSNNS